MTLTAHYRESISTMDTTRPLPLTLAKLPLCAHCGGNTWAWHTEQHCWLCQCYWHPERRPHYQRGQVVKPTQAQLPPTAGSTFMCGRNHCMVIPPGEEPWWTK